MRYFAPRLSKGFTLMELLVVISIIGLLASVVLASLSSARQKGRNSARVQQINQYIKALELTRSGTANQTYIVITTPVCLGDGYPSGICWGNTDESGNNTNLESGLIQTMPSFPMIPKVGNYGALYWSTTAEGTSYVITWIMEGLSGCAVGAQCGYCQLPGATYSAPPAPIVTNASRCTIIRP